MAFFVIATVKIRSRPPLMKNTRLLYGSFDTGFNPIRHPGDFIQFLPYRDRNGIISAINITFFLGVTT